jgi:uncharacterized protein YceK
MKNQIPATIAVLAVLVMLSGCGTRFTNLCEQKGATMVQMTHVLETVQDSESAQRAAPRLEPLVARLMRIEDELNEYDGMAEIGRMDEGSQRRFMQRYGELREMRDAFYEELDRVRADPAMFAPIEPVLYPDRQTPEPDPEAADSPETPAASEAGPDDSGNVALASCGATAEAIQQIGHKNRNELAEALDYLRALPPDDAYRNLTEVRILDMVLWSSKNRENYWQLLGWN